MSVAMRSAVRASVVAATVTAVVVPFSAPALAHESDHSPTVEVLSNAPLFPFQIAVGRGGVFVADGGTSTVTTLPATVVATGPAPGEVAGVALGEKGQLAFTTTSYATGATTLTIQQPGKPDVVADLSGFEQTQNPDQDVSYGVRNPSECVTTALEGMGAPVSYTGQVDSHPYSVASLGHAGWVVADAGGNDLLRVDDRGRVSLLAVLPAQPLKITQQMAGALGLPDCVVGVTYKFEAVPTDVEVGPHGQLYVSTLPGGPEGPVLGPRGSVYVVNQHSGRAHRIATGFLGATNVAVTPDGTVYVAELFGGQISVVGRNGKPKPLVSLEAALAVEWYRGDLYASTMAPTDANFTPTGTGSVVKIDLHD
jgi:hypothetical protein